MSKGKNKRRAESLKNLSKEYPKIFDSPETKLEVKKLERRQEKSYYRGKSK